MNKWVYPYSGTLGHLKINPKNDEVVPNKGPPTTIDARLIAEPTETPVESLGNIINKDSTIIVSTVQNNNILKLGIVKF